MRFEFGESQLNGVHVRRIRRQEQYPCPTLANRLGRFLPFVGRQVIEDDNIALAQGWGELGLDVGHKGVAIHGAIDHPWRYQAVVAKAGNESQGFPVAVGNRGDQPQALFCPSSKARHFGVQAGFVDEDDLAELLGVSFQPGLTPAPDGPSRPYVTAFLLSGVCGFFYS